DIRLSVAEGLPHEPEIALTVGGDALVEICAIRRCQAFHGAPAGRSLAPLVQIPIASHLGRPNQVQYACSIVRCRRTKYIARFRRLEDFGLVPFGAVPFASG